MPFEIDCKWVSYLKQFTLVDIILAWNLKKYNLKKKITFHILYNPKTHALFGIQDTERSTHKAKKCNTENYKDEQHGLKRKQRYKLGAREG